MGLKKVILIPKSLGNIYAFLIALLPLTILYSVFSDQIRFANIFLGVISVYSSIFLVHNIRTQGWRIRVISYAVPFLCYLGYALGRSYENLVYFIVIFLMTISMVAIVTKSVSLKGLLNYIVSISIVASFLVVLQTCAYYVFNVHLHFIPISFLSSDLDYYKDWILTGVNTSVELLHRPSAFFLEPAHMTQYCFVALAYCLLNEQRSIKKGVFISCGMFLTTSGFSMILVPSIWGLYFLQQIKDSEKKIRIKKIMIFSLVTIIVMVLVVTMPFFSPVLSRIFSPIEYSSDSYNAIWGRTVNWDRYIAPMSGRDLIFGFGYAALPGEYFTGLMKIVYCIGIVGAVLFFSSLVALIKQKIALVSCIASIFAGLMVFAQLTEFHYVIFIYAAMFALILDEKESSDGIIKKNRI